MSELHHSEAPSPAPIRAAGTRRITLTMRAEIDKADAFTGFPRSTAKPFQILTAFEQALPYLGLPALTQRLVGFLVRCTEPQDWEEGSRPIAWPSNIRLQELLCVSQRRVKMLIRELCENGLFVMRDHPQGKRFGRRDKQGRIIEAYGFDLSRLAQRQAEFKQITVDAEIERMRMRKLRQRATSARQGVMQAAEELTVQLQSENQKKQEPTMTTSTFTTESDVSETLDCLVRETAELVKAARACTHSAELGRAVKALESRKAIVENMLRRFIKPVETYPKGEENFTLNTSTSLKANHKYDTVIASEACSRAEAKPLKPPASSQEEKLFPERLNVTPATMVELAPRLAAYMPPRYDDRSWPALIEAALWLSAEMGINRTLWARACQVMGREYAAVALALVSTRSAGHFTSGPGGYFAGMLRKFERGELCLSRTIWKLKDELWGKERSRSERRI
jgi:replication initiation protein RepC